jgi:replicative superfamily II helicase
MSATLANIDDLLKFLDAQFYEERFRPVYNKIILNFISMIYFNIG